MQRNITILFKPKIPKYLQIADYLIESLLEKEGIEGVLPSINYLSQVLDVSRDTVEKAYRILKEKDCVEVIPGKGYFKKEMNQRSKRRIFLLFNRLDAAKSLIYNAFNNAFDEQTEIDFYVYNDDYQQFKRLSERVKKVYSHYIIIPPFSSIENGTIDILNNFPRQKLLLLDKKVEGFNGHFAAVYQNFEKNLFTALKIMGERLLKYEKIILVCPFLNPFPKGIIRGFQQFCKEYNKSGVLMDNISNEAIIKHAAYIVLTDDGLVSLIKKIREAKLKIGEEVGILSYNKHPFKEIIFEGITTISTDFEQMGAMVAQLVVENKQQQVEVPFQLCIRQSL